MRYISIIVAFLYSVLFSGEEVNNFDRAVSLIQEERLFALDSLLLSDTSLIYQTNNDGYSLLHYAIPFHIKSAEILLNRHANMYKVSSKMPLPIYFAIAFDSLASLELFQKYGYNWDYVDTLEPDRSNWLLLAAKNKALRVIDYLLNHGVRLGQRDIFGKTALHYAVRQCDSFMVNYFLQKGLLINIQDEEGNIPLMEIDHCSLKFIDFMIFKGANMNAINSAGASVLYTAVLNFSPLLSHDRDTAKIKWLIKKGARVAVDSTVRSPLTCAAGLGEVPLMNILIQKGMAINAIGKEGYPPLQAAIMKSKVEAVSFLLENGADVLVKNKRGENSLDVASKSRNKRIKALLLDAKTKSK